MRKKIITLTVLCLGIFLAACRSQEVEKIELNISVASSLVDPINEIIDLYTKDQAIKVNVNSGGSGTLKKQISEGANMGLFFSANEKYVDDLIEEDLVLAPNKMNLISNTLVLIKSSAAPTIESLSDLVGDEVKVAIGEVKTVPAGEYARESLMNLGLFKELESHLIYAKDVTAVKTYVERGEVDYGIVYQSDARSLTNGEAMMKLPKESYQDIVYSLALIEGQQNESEYVKLMEFIASKTGTAIFETYGFDVSESVYGD